MKKVRGFSIIDDAAQERMAKLAEMSEDQIDFSDIPEWDEQAFAEAVPFRSLFKPRKEQITARIDADVLAWLKSHGKGYQTLMNELLRKQMIEEIKR